MVTVLVRAPSTAILAALILLLTASAARAQTPLQQDLPTLYRLHVEALNRGDLPAAVADYAPDAVFIGPGGACSAATPCTGTAAIEPYLRGFLGTGLRAGIIELQVSGSTIHGVLHLHNSSVAAAGVERIRAKVTVTYAGDNISRDVVEYDPTDPQTAAFITFQQRAALLRQHYDGVSRGDVSAAVAPFSDDAVLVRGPCSAQVPCSGKAEVQRQIEREVGNQHRVTVLNIQASGTNVGARIELRSTVVRAVGIDRAIESITATFANDKIVRLVHELDLSDPQTVAWGNFQRVSGVINARFTLLQRGDVAGVMALFTEDAVYEGLGLCGANACVGKEAIQRQMERDVADGVRFTAVPGSPRASGDDFTSRVEIRSNPMRAAGIERVIATQTARIPGGRIAFLAYTLDSTDPQTAGYLALAPTRMPATGSGGLLSTNESKHAVDQIALAVLAAALAAAAFGDSRHNPFRR